MGSAQVSKGEVLNEGTSTTVFKGFIKVYRRAGLLALWDFGCWNPIIKLVKEY